ncbi:hypothetical protein T4E_9964 [Trichinella pseudospiralis]|uniref:Uncharacterized protein n=1 Tax=Trichinella pseudospiralis TaxID=6337 RepID=A0A0V0YFY4_TRIPS|nr:hypothetical protein T4E_9964 [Trichinella pseudospiralis]
MSLEQALPVAKFYDFQQQQQQRGVAKVVDIDLLGSMGLSKGSTEA